MRLPQAKDIGDRVALRAVLAAQRWCYDMPTGCPFGCSGHAYPAMIWDVCAYFAPPGALVFPEKVVAAKLKALVRRGLLRGCTCGCRGDFEVTCEGVALLGQKEGADV